MTEGTAALTNAVRPAVVGRYLGQLALVQAAFSTVPLAVATARLLLARGHEVVVIEREIELGLEETIIPARTIGRHLADMAEGRDPLELSTMIREEARAFSFVASEADAGVVDELDLPSQTRVVCIHRGGQLLVPEGSTPLRPGDDVVLITHRDSLDRLKAKVRRPE